MSFIQLAHGHGSVVAEEDLCVIKIGFYTAHFTVYQPRAYGHQEFCEDLPVATETVFVLNYLHDSMREVPVDFRILIDRNDLGRFARFEDVEQLDFSRDTVLYQQPLKQADAVFTVLHEFEAPGNYIGLVTASSPTGERIYTAVFPFAVGAAPWTTIWVATGVVLAVVLGSILRYLLKQSR